MVLLLPGLERVSGLERRIFVLVMGQEFIKQLVMQGQLFGRGVRQNILVTDVIQSWYGIEAAALLLVAQERHSLGLSALQGKGDMVAG